MWGGKGPEADIATLVLRAPNNGRVWDENETTALVGED